MRAFKGGGGVTKDGLLQGNAMRRHMEEGIGRDHALLVRVFASIILQGHLLIRRDHYVLLPISSSGRYRRIRVGYTHRGLCIVCALHLLLSVLFRHNQIFDSLCIGNG